MRTPSQGKQNRPEKDRREGRKKEARIFIHLPQVCTLKFAIPPSTIHACMQDMRERGKKENGGTKITTNASTSKLP